jgi:hypothetical protein
MKSEALNSKSETIFEIQMFKCKKHFGFRVSVIQYFFGFRYSDFGFIPVLHYLFKN